VCREREAEVARRKRLKDKVAQYKLKIEQERAVCLISLPL
jgi:hypothetical protein